MSDISSASSTRNGKQIASSESSSSAPLSKRRLIPLPGSEHLHDPETQNAIRKRIVEGLPRTKRPYDPNWIELVLPAEFMSTTQQSTGPIMPKLALSSTSLRKAALTQLQGSLHNFGTMLDTALTNGSLLLPRTTPEEEDAPDRVVTISPITPLGAGRTDPFANYPIKMNRGELFLIDQVNTGQDPTFRTLRERWLPVMIRGPATFHQFLANVSLNVSRVRGESLDNIVTVAHHSLAIRSVNQKLSDPVLKASDDVLLGILSFRCYNLVKGDFDAAAVHLEGLNNVVELRGGYHGVGITPMLVSLIYGVEMTRICRQDTKPLFPVPKMFDITQEQQFGNQSTPELNAAIATGPWTEIFPKEHPIIETFDNLNYAIRLAAAKAKHDQSWKVVNFVIRQMYPIVHKLMSLKVDNVPQDYWTIVQEATRLAIFFFLGQLRRECGALGVSTALFLSKFKHHMATLGTTIDWLPCRPLLLWMLFFGSLESLGTPEQDWYLETLVCVARRMDMKTWDTVVESVKDFLWVEDIYDSLTTTLFNIKMTFGKILSSFRSSANLREKPASNSQAAPIPPIQIIKSPIIVATTSVAQPKRSLRWVKSLSNLKVRPRPAIPDFSLVQPKMITKPTVGFDVIKLFQEVDSSTNPPYPPCLRSIPKDEQNGLLQIFNAERLIDTAFALLPSELQPEALSLYLYGQPVGKTMAGIEARMKQLKRANKNIGTEASVGNRDDWYTDAVFAQQSFTGTNPTTIELASADWNQRFTSVAKTQGRVDMAALLESAKAESLFIQDCSYFREASNAAPDATLKSDDGKRFGCAAVSLFHLSEEGNLHPLAIVIDFRMSIEDSVVIFNQRLSPIESTASEEQDWPWRYAKMCSQVSDWTRHELQVHLNDCHFVEEAAIVAAQRSFTAEHVVYGILEPHWLKTLSLNASARQVLVPKVVVEINGFSKAQTYAFLLDAYKRFNWIDRYIPADLERRGFSPTEMDDKKFHNYAWARNMMPMWNTLYTFVISVLSTVYKTDADVAADKAVGSWCDEMHSLTGGQTASFPNIKTIDDLTNAIVMCTHTASPQHNSVNYLQCYYMSFVPNKPACLNTALPSTLDELMSYKEQDIVSALPVHDEQVWLLSSQLPYLLSYGVSEDQTLLSYAKDLEDDARSKEGENWKAIENAASNFYGDLMKLGVVFDRHSRDMDDRVVPYNVMDPTELAVSILI
ncbi:hypothetical protein VTL71DRAFT_14972 [Oculimacula yallundae]|uniref:Manganese lipoxygenase n=1 Tax=Oculimacula yallundae TaxID=86028 RepID=A0ABR4CFU1_9HELO